MALPGDVISPLKKTPTSVAPRIRHRRKGWSMELWMCYVGDGHRCFLAPKCPSKILGENKNTMMFLVCLFYKNIVLIHLDFFFKKHIGLHSIGTSLIDSFWTFFFIVRCFCVKITLRCVERWWFAPWAEENPWGKDAFENATLASLLFCNANRRFPCVVSFAFSRWL